MKINHILQICIYVILFILFLTLIVRADNQIIPGNIGTSDPAPMVEGDTLYLYTTTDAVGNGDLSIYDIRCWSTTDLYHWKDCGVVLNENDIPWAAKKGNLWAPHCIKLGGKFHLYFPANDGAVFRMGHAVADKPTGPFKADTKFMSGCGVDAIDPFVFIDTGNGGTGKTYIGWDIVGATPNQVYLKELNATYDNATGSNIDITSGLGSPTRYKEGIWINKINGLWYCFLADWTGSVESITYSTATKFSGPYTKKGTVLNENTNSSTIHAGIVQFLGRWLMFYHTGGNEFGGSINTGIKRVVGAEYLNFDTSGTTWTVPQIAKTYRGVGVPYSYDTIQIDRHSPKGISGAQIGIVNGNEPRGWMVTKITNNGYIQYDNVDFSSTDKSSGEIRLRVASVSSGGSVDIREGDGSGTLISSVPIPATGDPTLWQTITAPVTKDGLALKGIKNLRLVFKTTASNQYTINWISIGKPLSTDIFKVAHFNPNQQSSTHITVNSRTNSTVSTLYNLLGQKTSIYNMTAAQDDKTHQCISPESDNRIVPGMYISK
jgi:hypothetical protein